MLFYGITTAPLKGNTAVYIWQHFNMRNYRESSTFLDNFSLNHSAVFHSVHIKKQVCFAGTSRMKTHLLFFFSLNLKDITSGLFWLASHVLTSSRGCACQASAVALDQGKWIKSKFST